MVRRTLELVGAVVRNKIDSVWDSVYFSS